jgi:hypothetical protein
MFGIEPGARFQMQGSNVVDTYKKVFEERAGSVLTSDILADLAAGRSAFGGLGEGAAAELLASYSPYQQALAKRQERNINLPLTRAQNEIVRSEEVETKEREQRVEQQAQETRRASRRSAVLEASRRARERIAQQNLSALGRARQGVLSPAIGSVGRGISGRQGFASVSNAVLG